MILYVCNGATMQCNWGSTPASLIVLPEKNIIEEKQPAANIMDHKSLVNIPPFGLCSSLSNPAVASATAAAFGVLTPQPCIPNTPVTWDSGKADILIKKMPGLTEFSQLRCTWSGMITITDPGQSNFKTRNG